MVHRPHQIHELLIDNADDLLARMERFKHPLTNRLLRHAPDKLAHHREADIRFEQRFLDELQPVAHVRFGQLALSAQRFQSGTEAVLQGFEHGRKCGGGQWSGNRKQLASNASQTGEEILSQLPSSENYAIFNRAHSIIDGQLVPAQEPDSQKRNLCVAFNNFDGPRFAKPFNYATKHLEYNLDAVRQPSHNGRRLR